MSNLRSFYNNLVPTLEVKKLGINLWLLKKIEDNVKVSPSFTIIPTGIIDIVMIFFSHWSWKIFTTLCGAPRLMVIIIIIILSPSKSHWLWKHFQYPLWRPPAQWSKTLGFSHTGDFNLFSLGEVHTAHC